MKQSVFMDSFYWGGAEKIRFVESKGVAQPQVKTGGTKQAGGFAVNSETPPETTSKHISFL